MGKFADPVKNLSQEFEAICYQVRVTHEIGCHEFPPLSRVHCLDEDMDTNIGQGYSCLFLFFINIITSNPTMLF